MARKAYCPTMAKPASSPPDRSPGEKVRRGGGARAIGKVVDRITGPARRARGLTVSELVTDWPRIVGPDIARASSPARYTAGPRAALPDEAGNGRPGGELLIRAGGPMALQLQHMTPTLIGRINGYFGYRAVARISFLQAPPDSRVPVRHPSRTKPPAKPTPDAELGQRLAPVAPGPLRDALARLGGRLGTRSAPPTAEPDGPPPPPACKDPQNRS
ncbi:MAG: DciA family protein [Alphaproteobacteria bacterium]